MIQLRITSPPDRDRVVVELWRDNVQLAEISNEDGTLRVEVYAAPGTNRVAIPLDDLEEARGTRDPEEQGEIPRPADSLNDVASTVEPAPPQEHPVEPVPNRHQILPRVRAAGGDRARSSAGFGSAISVRIPARRTGASSSRPAGFEALPQLGQDRRRRRRLPP